jgi:competence protein ComEC
MVPRILFSLIFFFPYLALAVAPEPLVRWTMINVNSAVLQGDAHLLELPGKQQFLIDAGDNENVLVPFLQKKGVKKLDKILVTHGHKDHYGGIQKILSAGIAISEVRMNFPSLEQCNAEKPWGCDWADLELLKKTLKDAKVSIKPQKRGDTYFRRGTVKLEALYAFDEKTSPVGKLDLNNTSVIHRLTVGKTTTLFTGDLNHEIGEYLSKHGQKLKSDILKVPHHGAERVAPDSFLDSVAPKLALVPSPKALWEGERCKRIRDYLAKKKIPTFVNGLDGMVEVNFDSGGQVEVNTEKTKLTPRIP